MDLEASQGGRAPRAPRSRAAARPRQRVGRRERRAGHRPGRRAGDRDDERGAANALGYADGQLVTRERDARDASRRSPRAVDVPVTADMEAGYGDTPEDAAATARGVVEAGRRRAQPRGHRRGRGDDRCSRSTGSSPRSPPSRQRRPRPACRSSSTLARTSSSARSATRDATRARRRARARLSGAGADCVFVPAVADPARSARSSSRIGGPVSVLAGPGSPTLSELARARRRAHQRRLGRLPRRARA